MITNGVRSRKISILLAGSAGVGKSTIAVSIINYLLRAIDYYVIEDAITEDEILMQKYFRQNVKMLEEGRFPERTRLGTCIIIKHKVILEKDKEIILEFLDVSGEDSRNYFSRRSENFFKNPKFMLECFERCNYIFLITDVLNAERDSKDFEDLTRTLSKSRATGKKVAIIVNKWDTINKRLSFQKYVQSVFSNIISFINVYRLKNFTFLNFKVGRVIIDENYKTSIYIQHNDSKKLFEWILKKENISLESERNNNLIIDKTNLKSEIIDCVSTGNIDEAFILLKNNRADEKSLALIESRYFRIRIDKQRGIVEESYYAHEIAKIEMSLLELANN